MRFGVKFIAIAMLFSKKTNGNQSILLLWMKYVEVEMCGNKCSSKKVQHNKCDFKLSQFRFTIW